MSLQLAAGLSHYQRRQYDSCRSLLEGLLGQSPSEWRAHYLMGLLDYNGQDFDRAERSLLAALRFVPPQKQCRATIYLALGMTLERQGEYARSKQHFITVLRLDSTSVAARNGLDRLTALTIIEP
ncbi:MAG: tetratricopeptide repeat protein [Candidatus Zixiibacteriota bacterium]|nr:MAG: tetratricopeptide repeat protein [candidate division Zixibacteria bacterium]